MAERDMRSAKAYIPRLSFHLFLFALLFALISLSSALFISITPVLAEMEKAPDFTATSWDNSSFSLSDFQGSPVVLHITNIENPLCIECEESLQGQVEELARLRAIDPSIQIITLNLRKNPYSMDGRTLAEEWWGINITWPWTEDIDPYPIGSRYLDYWTVRGGSSNPTIILIDREGNVGPVYHVYRVGEGVADGVQEAQDLRRGLEELNSTNSTAGALAEKRGTDSKTDSKTDSERLAPRLKEGMLLTLWTGIENEVSRKDVTALGMFLLGILTSLAPCSIALMIAVFSYVMTVQRKDEYLRKSTSTSREGFMIGVAFTIGMAAVFFVLGLFISQVGVLFRDSKLFDLIAGGIMILLGVSNFKPLGEILEPVISRVRPARNESYGQPTKEKKSMLQRSVEFSVNLFRYSAFIGAFTLGIFFALGWAPCALSMVMPVLIWLASQNIAPLAGGMMLFVFGVGHGVPIIPIATFSRMVGGRIGDKYISVGQWTTKFFGLLVILVGVVYAARYFGFLLW